MAGRKFWNHLMVDIETVSTRSNAKIISIGAAFFDISTGEIGPGIHAIVDYNDEHSAELHECPQTWAWWAKQSTEAQKVLTRTDRTPLRESLEALSSLIYTYSSFKDVQVWGNGASFDPVILDNAYHAARLSGAPWKHWNIRDVRTLVYLGRTLHGFDPKKDMPFEGVKHDARADAEHQAKYVSAIFRKLKQTTEVAA